METNREQLQRVKDFIAEKVPPQYSVGKRDASENAADLAIKVIRKLKHENAGFRKDIEISSYNPSDSKQLEKLTYFISKQIKDPANDKTVVDTAIDLIKKLQQDNVGLNHDVDVQDEQCRGLFYREIADCLPDEFIYWCAMRVLVHATTDENETSDPSAMTFADAFKLWEQRKK